MRARSAGATKASVHAATALATVEEGEVGAGAFARRRVWVALGAALVACVAAVLVAVGPANASRGVYRWPAAAPAGSSAPSGRMLFAPLLLSRHEPARVSVAVPCGVVRAAAPVGGERFTVLATTRDPASSGLWLVVEGGRLRLGVGGAVLAETPWSGAALEGPRCMVSAVFREDAWRLG